MMIWLTIVGMAAVTLATRALPLLAGLVGALAAWRTGSVFGTIAIGMAAYWLLRLAGV